MQEIDSSGFFRYAKLRYTISLISFSLILGVLGYVFIEKTSILDALYMTVITVSTVGYGEVIHLSPAGKIFTIILIIISYITFAFGISVITSRIVEVDIGFVFRNFKSKKKLMKMKDHVIVVGFGRNGREACDYFRNTKMPFVVIDSDPGIAEKYKSTDFQFVIGDATHDSALKEAQILNAKALLTTLPTDADNVFIVMSAKALNSNLTIISRAKNHNVIKKLKIAGTDHAINPEAVGGHRMAMLVRQPDVVSFFEMISADGLADTNLVEIVCSNLPEELLNHSIYELAIRNKSGANIIGFKNPDGSFVINPSPDLKMSVGTKLFVLGTPLQIAAMKEILKL